MRQFILGVLAAAVLTFGGSLALANGKTCGATTVSVVAPSDALGAQVCATVERTTRFLDACNLRVSEPLLIEVREDIPGASGSCLGRYTCEDKRIFIRTPDALEEVLDSASGFAKIDRSALFLSIVAHELAHAAFQETACTSAHCVENHEYVAHVSQMWALPEPVRDEIVAEYPVAGDVDPGLLNTFILGFAPDRFAAIAWQHFQQSGNGCAFVEALADGRETLLFLPE